MRHQQNERVRRADCVICTREKPGADAPRILQIIEGLTYHKGARCVDIALVFVVHNPSTQHVRFRVLHRGSVDGWLQPFSLEPPTDQMRILTQLYAGRIKENPRDPGSVLFHQRVNCLFTDPEPLPVSLAGPGGCFAGGKGVIRLNAVPRDVTSPRAFTSYTIPPDGCSLMQPGERSVFVLSLQVPAESYEQFVTKGGTFSVDSWLRLKREIEAIDLPRADAQEQQFYREQIAPAEAILHPDAYDIVIFQELGDRVHVDSGSIHITPVRPANEALARKVLWFFGHPQEFYLELSYAKKRPPTPSQLFGVVVEQHVSEEDGSRRRTGLHATHV